jgi:hypothetical protein
MMDVSLERERRVETVMAAYYEKRRVATVMAALSGDLKTSGGCEERELRRVATVQLTSKNVASCVVWVNG